MLRLPAAAARARALAALTSPAGALARRPRSALARRPRPAPARRPRPARGPAPGRVAPVRPLAGRGARGRETARAQTYDIQTFSF